MKMSKDTFEFKNRIYPVIQLSEFDTADGCHVDFGMFAPVSFMSADDGSLLYRIIDTKMYGYLPTKLIEKGTESEIRKYIHDNIG